MHPILFQIGDFYISTYGMLIVLGLIAGLGLATVLARREGISTDHLFDLAFIVLLSGFIGARLLFIAVNFVIINLVVDLVYAAMDPRISYANRN